MQKMFLFILIILTLPYNVWSQKDTLPPVLYYKMDCMGNFCHPTDCKKSPYMVDMPEVGTRCNLNVPFFDKEMSFNSSFTFQNFEWGKVQTAEWDLEIIDRNFDAQARILFTDFCLNLNDKIFNYYAPKFRLSPDKVYFKAKLGEKVSQVVTLRNTSSGGKQLLRNLELKSIFEKLETSGFQITHDFLPDEEIVRGKEYNFTISFMSDKKGLFQDSIYTIDSCRVTNKFGISAFVTDENSVEESQAEFFISPNPASDYIDIDLGNYTLKGVVENEEIKIFDIYGKCVLTIETRCNKSLQKIDISALPEGVYFVRMGNEKPLKFIKM